MALLFKRELMQVLNLQDSSSVLASRPQTRYTLFHHGCCIFAYGKCNTAAVQTVVYKLSLVFTVFAEGL